MHYLETELLVDDPLPSLRTGSLFDAESDLS